MIEEMKPVTSTFKKACNWIREILSTNARIKKLEKIHFGGEPHPADICPQCGGHTIRKKIEKVHETVCAFRYEHIQNTILFCTNPDCPYEETIASTKVKTDTPQTDNFMPAAQQIKRI